MAPAAKMKLPLLCWFVFSLSMLLGDEPAAPSVTKYPDHNPIASTVVMNRRSGGRSQELSGSVVGAKKLFLVVTPTEKYQMDNRAQWLEPRLVGPAGVKKLTELTPVATTNESGPVALNKTMAGRSFVHLGQPVEYGFGVKALSVIEFDLPEGYAQFLTTVSVDSMDPQDQDVKGSVRFKAFTDLPGAASQFPELDAKEKEKAAAEQQRLLLKVQLDLNEAHKKVLRAQERVQKEQQRLDEETKRYEDLLKKYPGVKRP